MDALSRTHSNRAYVAWYNMHKRCSGSQPKWQKNYVERGITVAPEWADFEIFVRDMGQCPDGLTIDRRDNDKGYCRENCQWATRKQQQNNTTFNRRVTYGGVTRTLQQWSEHLNMTRICLTHRLNRGWTLERAFTQTVAIKRKIKV